MTDHNTLMVLKTLIEVVDTIVDMIPAPPAAVRYQLEALRIQVDGIASGGLAHHHVAAFRDYRLGETIGRRQYPPTPGGAEPWWHLQTFKMTYEERAELLAFGREVDQLYIDHGGEA